MPRLAACCYWDMIQALRPCTGCFYNGWYYPLRSWLLVDFDRVIPPWALVLLTPSCLPMKYGIWIFWSFLMETPQYVCLFWIQVCHKKVGTWNMHPLFACGMMALAKGFGWFGRGCGLWYIQFLTSCKILQYTRDSLPVCKKLIIMHTNVINITITALVVYHSMYKHSWSSCNLQILVLSILLRYISNCQFWTSSYSLPWNHGAEIIYYITLLINSRLWDMGYNNR